MNDTPKESPLRYFKLGFWQSHLWFKRDIYELVRQCDNDLTAKDMAYTLRHIANEIDPK